jgi:hypothetical protein
VVHQVSSYAPQPVAVAQPTSGDGELRERGAARVRGLLLVQRVNAAAPDQKIEIASGRYLISTPLKLRERQVLSVKDAGHRALIEVESNDPALIVSTSSHGQVKVEGIIFQRTRGTAGDVVHTDGPAEFNRVAVQGSLARDAYPKGAESCTGRGLVARSNLTLNYCDIGNNCGTGLVLQGGGQVNIRGGHYGPNLGSGIEIANGQATLAGATCSINGHDGVEVKTTGRVSIGTSFNASNNRGSGVIITAPGSDVVVEHATLYGNGYFGVNVAVKGDPVIRNNMIEENDYAGIAFAGGKARVYDNVLVNNGVRRSGGKDVPFSIPGDTRPVIGENSFTKQK